MNWRALAQLITALENDKADASVVQAVREQAAQKKVPVLGITGTGGAGKSSLTDELIRRLRLDQGDALRVAVISIDPSRRKSGGALLGDRIRMNAPRVTSALKFQPPCPMWSPPARWRALI
jgi:methylmalonyl-CoA mutase